MVFRLSVGWGRKTGRASEGGLLRASGGIVGWPPGSVHADHGSVGRRLLSPPDRDRLRLHTGAGSRHSWTPSEALASELGNRPNSRSTSRPSPAGGSNQRPRIVRTFERGKKKHRHRRRPALARGRCQVVRPHRPATTRDCRTGSAARPARPGTKRFEKDARNELDFTLLFLPHFGCRTGRSRISGMPLPIRGSRRTTTNGTTSRHVG